MNATKHRWGVALMPLVAGVFAVAIKATVDQELTTTTYWLLANAALTGMLTVYLNWIRGMEA